MKPLVLYLNQGEGNRLGSLTENIPKSMLEVGGRHLCDYFFDIIRQESLDVLITTKGTKKHEKSNTYFRSVDWLYKGLLSLEYTTAFTQKALIAVLSVRRSMKERGYDSLVVFPNDVIYTGSISELLDFHYQEKSDLTILAAPDPQPELATMRFGVEDSRIVSLTKGKPEPEDSIRLAIVVYNIALLSDAPGFLFNLARDATAFLKGNAVTRIFEKYRIHLVKNNAFCWNINTLEDYQTVCDYFSSEQNGPGRN